jgi:hypothetical protein
MTRNPLPKIEASGVAVAPIIFFVLSFIGSPFVGFFRLQRTNLLKTVHCC